MWPRPEHTTGWFGRQGAGWARGFTPCPQPHPGEEAGVASITIHVVALTLLSRNPGTVEIHNIKHSWSYV